MINDRLLRRVKKLIAELKAPKRVLRHFLKPPKSAPPIRRATERRPRKPMR